MLMIYFHIKFHSLAHYLSQQDNPSGQLACCCFTSYKNYPNTSCIFFEDPLIHISWLNIKWHSHLRSLGASHVTDLQTLKNEVRVASNGITFTPNLRK